MRPETQGNWDAHNDEHNAYERKGAHKQAHW
jgi:hypothetical protein